MASIFILDPHMHTTFSDGDEAPEKYVSRAQKIGIYGIGFSDHFSFDRHHWSIQSEELSKYFQRINSLKEKSEIPIKAGIELCYIPEYRKRADEIVKQWESELDYCIKSVHEIEGGWDITNEKYAHKWGTADVVETYRKYYDRLHEMVKSGYPGDIIGHFEVIRRFREAADYDANLYEKKMKIVESIAKKDICVEINVSGIRHPCKRVYKDLEVLEYCCEKGVDIVISSDAHNPGQMDEKYYREGIKMAKEAGYNRTAVFTDGKKDWMELK